MCYVHNQWYDISCATLYVSVSAVCFVRCVRVYCSTVVLNLFKIHLKNRVMKTRAFSILVRLLNEDKESVTLVVL